jgi:hypothetical protein
MALSRWLGLSDGSNDTETDGCPVMGPTLTLSLSPETSFSSFSSLVYIWVSSEKIASIKSLASTEPYRSMI